MMKNIQNQDDNQDIREASEDIKAASKLQEQLTAIHAAAQLMCRQSEGRQTYPVAKSIVMLAEQALATCRTGK